MAMTFDGVSSGLPTDQMIKAIMSQESAPLTRLQNRQTLNTQRKNALSSIKSSLMSIATAMTALNSNVLNKRAVSSSDSAIASATASGAAKGAYDLKVTQLATKARLETTSTDIKTSNDLVGVKGDKFTLTGGKNGPIDIELNGNTTLAGLNSRINAESSKTGITSTVVQVKPGEFRLILTSSETGGGKIGISGTFNDKVKTNASLTSSSESVGTAGDTFTVKGKDGEATITLLADKTSLADLSDSINAKSSDTGVSSSVVRMDNGKYELVLTSTDPDAGTGDIKISASSANNKLGIAIGSTPQDTGLEVFNSNKLGVADNFDPDASMYNGFRTTAGENAKFTLNGIDMERATNTFSDAIEGVTLTLNSASDKTVTLNVAMDKDAITKMFQDVVDKFNSAYKAYKDATAAGGPLERDLSMQTVFSQLRSKMSVAIPGQITNENTGMSWMGVLGSSSSIGLSTNRDGTFALDAKTLGDALDKNPDMVGQIFDRASRGIMGVDSNGKPVTKVSGATGFIDSLTIGGNSIINNIINGIDSINSTLTKQIDDLNFRLSRREEVLKAQFAKMEQLIGQMQSAGQSLGGLSSWS